MAVDNSFNEFVSPFFASASEYPLVIQVPRNGPEAVAAFPLLANIKDNFIFFRFRDEFAF